MRSRHVISNDVQIKTALSEATARLTSDHIGSARMAAETLLMHVLRCDRAHLHAHPERELSATEAERFDNVVARRASGVPLQYITGHQEFYGLEFMVTPAVLIPRPETEHLVEAALKYVGGRANERLRVVDVGTGSGCIILAIAHETRDVKPELHATDISPDALKVASYNATRLGLAERVQFHRTDLLSAFMDQPRSFDLVVSNPPYVGTSEPDKVQREVREHEPHVAVFGGEHGLDVYRRLIPQAHNVLKSGGGLMMEIGYSIEEPVRGLLTEWRDVHAIPDLQGIPRVVVATKA
jgi:release factor glutamine methyltransferase